MGAPGHGVEDAPDGTFRDTCFPAQLRPRLAGTALLTHVSDQRPVERLAPAATRRHGGEGNFKLASVFAEAALSGAIANGYPVGDIEALMESRDFAKALAVAEN